MTIIFINLRLRKKTQAGCWIVDRVNSCLAYFIFKIKINLITSVTSIIIKVVSLLVFACFLRIFNDLKLKLKDPFVCDLPFDF